MTGLVRIRVRRYRGVLLELFQRRPDGWAVAIHDPPNGRAVVLRNRVPRGLAGLVEEAQRQVDRRLDRPLCDTM